MFGERDALLAQLELRAPQVRPAQTEQLIRSARSGLRLRHFLEGQYLCVELQLAVEVADRHEAVQPLHCRTRR